MTMSVKVFPVDGWQFILRPIAALFRKKALLSAIRFFMAQLMESAISVAWQVNALRCAIRAPWPLSKARATIAANI